MSDSVELPDDFREALGAKEFAAVQRWWETLTPKQRQGYADASAMTASDFETLPDVDPETLDPDELPFYDYLVNHELRLVGFVDESAAKSSYRIMSAYVASLGDDYRHGEFGTVR